MNQRETRRDEEKSTNQPILIHGSTGVGETAAVKRSEVSKSTQPQQSDEHLGARKAKRKEEAGVDGRRVIFWAFSEIVS